MTTTEARSGWLRFTLHYVEMIIAMFVGMFALGFLQSAVGLGISHMEYPDLGYLVMAFNMSVGMAVWMRFRGHAWRPTLEMCAVMFAPAVPLFPLLWLDVIDGGTLMMVAHIAMFPLMLGVMLLRRAEYAHH
ncbi:hypothetical protein Aple_070880 [Acrocarpospora pleiomorpha]|uniref:Flagellar biosynthetic protein FliP n=1 Tax=Acrocarpospora pleiomorpha TaxID=90975 RepID=A0A5M3XVV0_9ACTN|nr:hypothetical protein [Acrocarpospora pleiomorpha]GES24189.1 hypothetical protein Aple_070880 [Acrocarpospora pleiomorpha]